MQCPLCLREFGRGDIDGLTEEHVIPQSAGGTEVTLSCKSCNNLAGSKIDSHFARKIRVDRANAGKGKMKGHIRIGDIGAPADYAVGPGGDVQLHIKPTTLYAQQELLQRFGKYSTGERVLRIKVDHGIASSRFLAALVKAAYLGLFADWGYRYALLPSLDPVRNAISKDGPDRDRLPEIVVPSTIIESSIESSAAGLSRFSFEAAFPPGIPAAATILNLPNGAGAFWVMLPPMSNPHRGSWDGLARAALSVEGKADIKMELKEDRTVIISGL